MDREKIREKMRSNARNLCEYVVKTTIEYKEELLRLEADLIKKKRKIQNLKNLNDLLKEDLMLLMEENEEKEQKLRKLLSRGNEKICYNCTHLIQCGGSMLCIYCSKLVCNCCANYCQEEVNCINTICRSCFSNYERCPAHSPNFPEKKAKELLSYFEENKYKHLFN